MFAGKLSRRLGALLVAATFALGACGGNAPAPSSNALGDIVISDFGNFAFGISGAMRVPGFDQPVSTSTGVLALVSTPQYLTAGKTISAQPGTVDQRWTAILAQATKDLKKAWTTGYSAENPLAIYAGTFSAEVEARRHGDGSLNQADLPPTKGLSAKQLLTLQLASSVPAAVLATGQNEFVTASGHDFNSNDNFDVLGAISAARASGDKTLEASLTVVARNNRTQYNIRWQNRWALLKANGYGKIATAEKKVVKLAEVTAPISSVQDFTPIPVAPAGATALVAEALGTDVDPRWGPILDRANAALAVGAQCTPASATNPIPMYSGTYSADVEGRRRSDGSLNPSDLPSTQGLSSSQLIILRIANSVPNAILLTGQNEGVAATGKAQNTNDSYDLLGWASKLRGMAAGTIAPLKQDNGYTWTADDISRNLALANSNIAANQDLYNLRWQTRWSLLDQAGYASIATAERGCIGLVNPQSPAAPLLVVVPTATGGPGATTGDQLMTVPVVTTGGPAATSTGGLTWAQIDAAQTRFIAAQDLLLKAAGKPYGHDGAVRGATTAQEGQKIASDLGIVREMGFNGLYGDPTHPIGTGADWSAYSRVVSCSDNTGMHYTLFVMGKQIADEVGGPSFDTVDFALRHNAPEAVGMGAGPMDVPSASTGGGGSTQAFAPGVQVPITADNVQTINQVADVVGDKNSITPAQLQTLLAGQPELLAQAVSLGYFGAPGTYPGIDYAGFSATVTVQSQFGTLVTDWKNGVQTGKQIYAAGTAVPAVGISGTSGLPIAASGSLTAATGGPALASANASTFPASSFKSILPGAGVNYPVPAPDSFSDWASTQTNGEVVAKAANDYWNDANAALIAGKSVGEVFPASATVERSGSPETQATSEQYRALVLGQLNPDGTVSKTPIAVDVAKGLTPEKLGAEIKYLQNLAKTGDYNENLAMISSPQAVASLIASEQVALAGMTPTK